MNQFHTVPGAMGLLKPIEFLLSDSDVSEIVLNYPGEVFYEKRGNFFNCKIVEFSTSLLKQLFQLIATESKQVLDQQNPILAASLHSGHRVQLLLPPITPNFCFAIRKHGIKSMTLSDYQDMGYFEKINATSYDSTKELLSLKNKKDWYQFIKRAIALKKNIVISGGTSTGKTTFLNACIAEIPIEERIVIIEDTREIVCKHKNKVQLLSSKGEQSLAKISMQDLVQCSLRLRPDRILCGEIRGKEFFDFICACQTGHPGSMTTLHANSSQEAFTRMMLLYKLNHVSVMTNTEILEQITDVVDVIVQLERGPSGRVIKDIYYHPKNSS